MNIITVHSSHERCGISEYGKQLDAALARCGVMPEAITFDSASARVLACKDGDVVFVHFEPLLVPKGGFLGVLQEARARGARVVLCCHYYDPSVFSTAGMKAVDRFVLHRHYSNATHPKFVEIPLGCPVYETIPLPHIAREQFGLPREAIVLTTLGFLSPWKKMPEVITALLAKAPSNVFFQILTPQPFNDSSTDEADMVRDAIARSGSENVYFSTTFRPERELLDRVRASDLGFLFHSQDTGSVSAATKQFVSTRTPLIATQSTHASDLSMGVHRVRSFDPNLFAEEVIKTAGSKLDLAILRSGMEREYERINMNAVAERYLTLFRSL